jgi:hypothetical protein
MMREAGVRPKPRSDCYGIAWDIVHQYPGLNPDNLDPSSDPMDWIIDGFRYIIEDKNITTRTARLCYFAQMVASMATINHEPEQERQALRDNFNRELLTKLGLNFYKSANLPEEEPEMDKRWENPLLIRTISHLSRCYAKQPEE